jgi:hypothetical protein
LDKPVSKIKKSWLLADGLAEFLSDTLNWHEHGGQLLIRKSAISTYYENN